MNATYITSRQNPLIKRLYRLTQVSSSYHELQEIWLEGEHLCQAFLKKNGQVQTAICSKSSYEHGRLRYLSDPAQNVYVLEDTLFVQISALQSAAGIAYLIKPQAIQKPIDPEMPTVVLDRLQDPGNVGSILRSAAAFGFRQIVALKGSSALWAPKVLRAAMGAHFSLNLHEQYEHAQLQQELQLPLIGSSSHTSEVLQQNKLPWPCAVVVGNEGQGIAPEILQQCRHVVRIDQPGGEESLNAAIAASIFMYELSKQA